ncbi:MAG: conjugative transposon protein TraN [Prolixibacteraceae bacterium]
MKILISALVLFSAVSSVCAQNGAISKKELPRFYISDGLSVHFVSPEPIQYVDISTSDVVGDIPVDNVLRIKYYPDSLGHKPHDAQTPSTVVTIVGQSFMAQYDVIYTSATQSSWLSTRIEILPKHMEPLDFPEVTMTRQEIRTFAMEVIRQKRTYRNVASKALGMTAWLNNIFSSGDYVFVDVSFKNSTRIKYDIDQLRFRIRDKRITKATNVQDLELKPVFTLYDNPYFQRRYRNVFVFRKFTYPGNKVLSIQMAEEQISGRTVELSIDYSDLLNADTL